MFCLSYQENEFALKAMKEYVQDMDLLQKDLSVSRRCIMSFSVFGFD